MVAADAPALLALLVRLRDAYEGGYFVTDDGLPVMRDHACAECWPGGNDSMVAGFRCPYHELLVVTANVSRDSGRE